MAFREACKVYFVYGPIMSNKPMDKPDGNGMLYLAHYFSILKLLGELDLEKDRAHFERALELVKISRGKYIRRPGDYSHEAHDNIVGIARMAQIFNHPEAHEIYQHGLENDWSYNNTGKQDVATLFKSWHWRIMGTTQHYKICDKKVLTPFDQFAFQMDKFSTNLKPWDATSGRLLDWIKLLSYLDNDARYPRCDIAVESFVKTIKTKYRGGMQGVFGKYFSPSHAFAEYTKDIILPI